MGENMPSTQTEIDFLNYLIAEAEKKIAKIKNIYLACLLTNDASIERNYYVCLLTLISNLNRLKEIREKETMKKDLIAQYYISIENISVDIDANLGERIVIVPSGESEMDGITSDCVVDRSEYFEHCYDVLFEKISRSFASPTRKSLGTIT
jgi:hypothetical protein